MKAEKIIVDIKPYSLWLYRLISRPVKASEPHQYHCDDARDEGNGKGWDGVILMTERRAVINFFTKKQLFCFWDCWRESETLFNV